MRDMNLKAVTIDGAEAAVVLGPDGSTEGVIV